tara:strand:+ start:6715 stop:8130 length:1416 start_codon:yes stop_codon:yes gene_type:complete
MLKNFGKDFIIYGVSSSISKFVGLFLVPLYTRIFTPDEYGSMDLISTVVAFIAIIGMMQLESAVSRYYYAEKSELERNSLISTAIWTLLVVSVVLLFLLIFFAKPISILLFDTNAYATILIIGGATIPFANLNGIFTVIMRFKRRPVHYMLFQLAHIFFTISTTIVLVVYYKIGIIGVFIGQLGGFVIIVLLMTFYLQSNIKFIWNKSYFYKMMRYSLPLVPAVGGSWTNSYINRFVMVGYLSITEIGLYVVALKFASVLQLIGAAFRMAWPPFFWETFENNKEHKKVFRNILQHVSPLVFSVVILLTIYAEEIVKFFATEQYLFSANLIGMLALSYAITNILSQIIMVGPGITKKTEFNTIIYFISVGVNVTSLFILVPSIGLIGVPVSLLLGSFSLLAVGWYNSEKLYPIGFKKTPIIISLMVVVGIVCLNYYFNLQLFVKLILTLSIIIYFLIKYRSVVTQFFWTKKY